MAIHYSKKLILKSLNKEYSNCVKRVMADDDSSIANTVTKEDVDKVFKCIEEIYKYIIPYFPLNEETTSTQKTFADFY